MNQQNLNKELINWFNTVNKSKNFWNANPIAKTIKENLSDWGNFKSNSRGDPREGKRKSDWVKAKKNGYEGDYEDFCLWYN
jgi:hypothetical protein